MTEVFKTIEDDQVIFKKITQKHLISIIDDTETISQKRIIKAFTFFENELCKFDDDTIDLIQQTLEEAVISTFFISNKVEATQVFEYQNNRGKELSKFEVIKAYLMHQIYIHSYDNKQANNDIADIQLNISQTYRYIEAVEGYVITSYSIHYTKLYDTKLSTIQGTIAKVIETRGNINYRSFDWNI